MRLKLLAPFTIDGFRLRPASILQHPEAYEQAWDRVARRVGPGLDGVPGVETEMVERHLFMHTSDFVRTGTSRYQSIEDHSLERPLHVAELVVRFGAGTASEDVGPGARVEGDADGGPSTDSPEVGLVRVFDHGVALLEIDLAVPRGLLDAADTSVQVGPELDAMQKRAVDLAEARADRVKAAVVDPLCAWLGEQEELRGSVSVRAPRGGRRSRRTTALWVTRSLVIASSDPLALAARRQVRRRRHAIAEHWLKDVDGSREIVETCREGAPCHSTRWLNYFFFAGESGGEGEAGDGSRVGASFDYPERGWLEADHALAFCPTWDAVLIAQYYYAAFDLLQSGISRILAVSMAGEGTGRISGVKADLDGAVRDAQMLKVDFEENRKYYSRRVGGAVQEVLDGWAFFDRLLPEIDRRIEDCTGFLEELHQRAMERSAVYTDFILLAIGVTVVFDLLLSLSLYGRTMAGDPDLAVYDRTSALNIPSWIGGSSTDVILLAGLVCAVGLGLLYAYFRTGRPRV